VRASQNDNDDDDNDFEEEEEEKEKEDDAKCSFRGRDWSEKLLHSPNDTRVRVHLPCRVGGGGGGKREEEEEERKQILLRLQEEIGRVFAL
tara:strand:+ start:470 stop:742 length:273 start_codon:yes stop_codon:yes gene_type:complete